MEILTECFLSWVSTVSASVTLGGNTTKKVYETSSNSFIQHRGQSQEPLGLTMQIAAGGEASVLFPKGEDSVTVKLHLVVYWFLQVS
jgi:hypothetical protein